MRVSLKVNINSTEEEKKFPNNYRQEISKLLKEWLGKQGVDSDQMEWDDKIVNSSYIKPFTFSVYLPKAKPSNRKILFNSNFFLINLSFGDYHIYDSKNTNGAINLKGYDLFNKLQNSLNNDKENLILDFTNFGGEKYSLTFNDFLYRKEKIDDSTEQSFKSLSPILICRKEKNKSPKWLIPGNPEFDEWFNQSIKSLSKKFLDDDNFEVRFKPINIKKIHITHYDEHMIGFSGSFSISAPKEILKLVYEIGLGAKRNEGFGMIESLTNDNNKGKSPEVQK